MKGRGRQEAEASQNSANATFEETSNLFIDAYTTSNISDIGKPIKFDRFESTYTGMDASADGALFTMPQEGIYEINCIGQSTEQNTAVSLRLNGKMVALSSYILSARQDPMIGGSIFLSSTINLKTTDKIEVVLEEGQLQEKFNFYVYKA